MLYNSILINFVFMLIVAAFSSKILINVIILRGELRKMSKKDVNKVVLDEADIPKQWYNILADMPNKPAPYFSSNTGKPATVEELQAIFPLD